MVYEGQESLGGMVREAAAAATHDEVEIPDLKRLNDIQVGEVFVNLLANAGCMVTRIPRSRADD